MGNVGRILHHAIVVTSWDERLIEVARERAVEIFSGALTGLGGSQQHLVGQILSPSINGFRTFCIAPDGGVPGWLEATSAASARASFVAWLESMRYDDGSTSLHYVYVQFGGESPAAVVASSDDVGGER